MITSPTSAGSDRQSFESPHQARPDCHPLVSELLGQLATRGELSSDLFLRLSQSYDVLSDDDLETIIDALNHIQRSPLSLTIAS